MSTWLTEIEERVKAATPGPWCYENIGEKENTYAVGSAWKYDDDTCAPIGGHLNNADDSCYTEAVCFVEEQTLSLGGSVHSNATLIAHAPTDLTRLIADNRRLREALAFYADPKSWTDPDQVNRDEMFDSPVNLIDNYGDRARTALTQDDER